MLEKLDLEQLNSHVNKYTKHINQMEKGLPRNNVVPCLKEKVELMKQRVGVFKVIFMSTNETTPLHR